MIHGRDIDPCTCTPAASGCMRSYLHAIASGKRGTAVEARQCTFKVPQPTNSAQPLRLGYVILMLQPPPSQSSRRVKSESCQLVVICSSVAAAAAASAHACPRRSGVETVGHINDDFLISARSMSKEWTMRMRSLQLLVCVRSCYLTCI